MGAFDDLIPPKSKPADGGINPRLFNAFQETLATTAPAAGAFDDLIPARATPDPFMGDAAGAPPAEEGFLDSIGRRYDEITSRSLGENLRQLPLDSMSLGQSFLRGIGAGYGKMAGGTTMLLGMPVAAGIDLIRGDNAATDAVGREVESNYALADRLMRGDPRAANPENQLAAGGGQVALDLAAALLTRGGSAEANALAQLPVRQAIGRAAEEAIEQGARASIVPSLSRASDLGRQVVEAGGTSGEALDAFAAGGAANTAAFMLPGAAGGSFIPRTIGGAAAEVPAGYLQQQVENVALPDRLGLDQEYSLRDAALDAILGGGLGGVIGDRGPAPLADPDVARGSRSALDDSAFADLIPAEPPIARRPDAPAAPAAEPVPAAAEAAPPAPAAVEPVATVAAEPAPVPPVEAGTVRAAEETQPAFHGSRRNDIERIQLDRIGTGSGEANYGFGAYFAGTREGADAIRSGTSGLSRVPGGVEAEAILSKFGGDRVRAAADLRRQRERAPDARRAEIDTVLNVLRAAPNRGTTYTTEIPADSRLLAWDEPLSAQPEAVRAALAKLGITDPDLTGGRAYRALSESLGGQREASDALSAAGVPGNRYRDGRGGQHYVVWDEGRIAPLRNADAVVQSDRAPPPAVTPQAEPAPASPPVTPPAAVRASEPAAPDQGGEPTSRAAPAPTSTKNRVTDAERAAEGRDPILRQMRRTHPETMDLAHEARRDNPGLVDEITSRTGDVHINDTEEAVLMLAKVDERNRRERASSIIADPKASPSQKAAAAREWDEAEAALNRIDEANAARGTTWGRFGNIRQREIAADYTLEAMRSKLRRAKGKGLDKAEDEALEALSAKLEAAQTDLETARAKIAEYEQSVIVRQTIEQAVREATAQMRGQRGGRSKLDVLKERADAARKRLDSSYAIPDKKGQSGSVINPAALIADVLDIGIYHVANGATKLADWVKAMTADLGERFTALQDRWPDLFAASRRAAAPAKPDAPTTAEVLAAIDPANVTREDVRDLVMARIRAGEKDADTIMRAVTADLQTIVPDATEADVRQLFADYGKRASPTRDADQQTLRDLRTVVRLEREIADAEAGLPRKTPRARQQATEAVRQLRARLAELLKQAGRRARTPEAEAALLAKRREVLEKQIADLGDQVDSGRRPAAGTPRLTPEQLKDLTDQRDRLRNRIRWLDREAKKAADAPAKAAAAAKQRENDRLNLIDGLNAQAERIQAQIDGGYREIPKSTQKVMDAGVAEARRKLAEVKEARREVDRQTFADEIAAAKAEKRRADLSEQIADLEDMLRTGRRPEKRDRTESSPDLAARRDELRREIRRIDAAARPRRSPEEVYQQRRGTSIEREIERIQARLSAGDYARSPRVPKALNEANKAAALRLEELRAEFKLKQFDYEMNNSGWMKRVGGYAAQALHLQRAIQTSYDLSGIGRQGVFSLFGHTIRTAKAIPEMLRAAGSREERLASEEDIKSRENAPLYKKYRLPINDSTLNRTEEVFTSRWLEKLRLKHKEGEAGKNAARLVVNAPLEITRGSERAYATVLNRLRADAFDAFHAFLSEGGRPITDRQGQIISDFVAATTGRSNVPLKVEGLANGLNLVYFAARLVWSRFQVLYGHHVWMAALNGEWRAARFMAQEYGRVAGAMALFYALATAWYVGSGEEEEDEKKGDRRPFIDRDPRSSAFGQLRFGDHYINPTGGLSQAATFMARMMTGETVTGSGETVRLSDDPSRSLSNKLASLAPVFRKYGLDDLADAMPEQNTEKRSPMAADFGDVLARFNRTKLSPVFGAGWDWITGEDFMGQPTTTAEILANMMLPMTIGTPWQAFQTESPGKAAGLTLSEIGGWAVQHWDRAALEAPDQATMSPEQRAKYNEYLRVTGNMKQDLDAIRDLANSFPEDASASDVRDAVQMKADELGLDGIDVGQYARKTTARDENGVRRAGLKRTEAGNVQMEYAKGSRTKLMMDTEKSVNKINAEMRDFLLHDLTDEQIDAEYQKYVPGASADGEKEAVIRQMRDERDRIMQGLMNED